VYQCESAAHASAAEHAPPIHIDTHRRKAKT
jgi:hypothetical protein